MEPSKEQLDVMLEFVHKMEAAFTVWFDTLEQESAKLEKYHIPEHAVVGSTMFVVQQFYDSFVQNLDKETVEVCKRFSNILSTVKQLQKEQAKPRKQPASNLFNQTDNNSDAHGDI